MEAVKRVLGEEEGYRQQDEHNAPEAAYAACRLLLGRNLLVAVGGGNVCDSVERSAVEGYHRYCQQQESEPRERQRVEYHQDSLIHLDAVHSVELCY